MRIHACPETPYGFSCVPVTGRGFVGGHLGSVGMCCAAWGHSDSVGGDEPGSCAAGPRLRSPEQRRTPMRFSSESHDNGRMTVTPVNHTPHDACVCHRRAQTSAAQNAHGGFLANRHLPTVWGGMRVMRGTRCHPSRCAVVVRVPGPADRVAVSAGPGACVSAWCSRRSRRWSGR